ncbi:MAG: hypothetical protein QM790_16460 [Nibricoccus sp.]
MHYLRSDLIGLLGLLAIFGILMWLSSSKGGVRRSFIILGLMEILMGVGGLITGKIDQYHRVAAPLEGSAAIIGSLVLLFVGGYTVCKALRWRPGEGDKK